MWELAMATGGCWGPNKDRPLVGPLGPGFWCEIQEFCTVENALRRVYAYRLSRPMDKYEQDKRE